MGWARVWGPAETCECGDVDYEIGSTYSDGDLNVSICYFVTETNGTWGVEYRCHAWIEDDEQSDTITYDWASAKCYTTLAAAIEEANRHAVEDESWMFEVAEQS